MRHLAECTGKVASAPSTSYSSSSCCSRHRKSRPWTYNQPLLRGCGAVKVGHLTCERPPRLLVLRASNNQDSPVNNVKNTSAPGATPADQPTSSASPGEPTSSAAQPELELVSMWETIKKDVRKELSPEEAQVLDTINVDDLMGDTGGLMKKLADEQLGPLLQSLGVSEDPLTFFVDLLRLATALQLLSAGALFYGVELWGGLDSGEAFRCVCGLAAGYLSRPFFKVEQLLWPLYDWGLRILAPGAVYEVTASREESQATLTRLGVAVSVCSFLPQLLLGWDSSTAVQFVLPLTVGWLLFDVTYMAALLAMLQRYN